MTFPFTKTQRIKARCLARDCYIRCDGDVERAFGIAKDRKSELGNPLIVLTIGVLLLQGIYYALRVWNEMNFRRPPIAPLPLEGFELAGGERYALTQQELSALLVEGGE